MPAKKEFHKELEVKFFKSTTMCIRWLVKNHQSTDKGLWVKLARKKSGIASITYEQARDEAIRFGWIDGLINQYDDSYYLIRFTPRRPRSKWSKINRTIAQQLIKDKKMMPAGLQQVELAKADGRWDAAYDSQRTIEIPPELTDFLNENPPEKEFFESLTSSQRYSFLYRIQTPKREATRAKHMAKTIEMLKARKTYR